MSARLAAAVLAAALIAIPPAAAQAPEAQPRQTDLFKEAGNFLANCDARAGATGERPEETYLTRLCLSFVDGLIAGYTAGAIANGNERPYCLPRPVTLVEVTDMITTVIDRGIAPETPTAQVFHYLLTVNFPCDGPPGAPAAGAAPPKADRGDANGATDESADAADGEETN